MANGFVARADWRRGDCYEYLHAVERPMFAWEWLRRGEAYDRAWARHRRSGWRERAEAARRFGLVELLSPALNGNTARPVWTEEHDPHVIRAVPEFDALGAGDCLDIRHFAGLVAIASGDDDVEHWRIGTAAYSIRLDVCGGTLLGGPTPLRFDLAGLARLRPKLSPLDNLIRLSLSSQPRGLGSREVRAGRWIAELRTADALAVGATQQEIARMLYGAGIPSESWRGASDSYRYRVQRLARAARARVADPLMHMWFDG